MSEGAKVNSLDSIKEFRAYLVKFRESANLALGDADSDINKTQTWLEGEQQSYWAGQIRKRQEALVKAEEAYRQKKLYKDSSGSTPSAVDEQKALNIAKKNLADANQKMANVKSWQRKLHKELVLYRGGVSGFANTVSSGIPMAIAMLSSYLEQLEKYLDLGVGGEAGAGSDPSLAGTLGSGGRGPSMARGTDSVPIEEKKFDPSKLRAVVPAEADLEAAVGSASAGELPKIAVPAEQLTAVESLSAGAEVSGSRIVWPADLDLSKPAVLVHMPAAGAAESIWYASSVDATAAPGYNVTGVNDLLTSQPDLRLLLSLPAGFVVVVDSTGISAIFDQSDRSRWDLAAK